VVEEGRGVMEEERSPLSRKGRKDRCRRLAWLDW
jgi:hypothetical protein